MSDFKVGDRVKITGPVTGFKNYFHRQKASITSVDSESLKIKTAIGLTVVRGEISRRQVVCRLRKKPSPPARIERWVNVYSGLPNAVCHTHPDDALLNMVKGCERTAHLVEKFPGEVLVTRERLAEAWDECVPLSLALKAGNSGHFASLCKALGLEVSK